MTRKDTPELGLRLEEIKRNIIEDFTIPEDELYPEAAGLTISYKADFYSAGIEEALGTPNSFQAKARCISENVIRWNLTRPKQNEKGEYVNREGTIVKMQDAAREVVPLDYETVKWVPSDYLNSIFMGMFKGCRPNPTSS